MPQFAPGEVKTAIAPIVAKPSGMSCEAELFLGPDELTKVATSGRIPFVSTGAAKNVSLPIAMPSSPGTVKGYIDVFVGGFRFLAYILKEDIVIVSPYPLGITILGITAQKKADGSLEAYVKWVHTLTNWRPQEGAFASVLCTPGRYVNGVWEDYYWVEHHDLTPDPHQERTTTCYWPKEAVDQMPSGLCGFRAHVIAYIAGWMEIGRSPEFTVEDLVTVDGVPPPPPPPPPPPRTNIIISSVSVVGNAITVDYEVSNRDCETVRIEVWEYGAYPNLYVSGTGSGNIGKHQVTLTSTRTPTVGVTVYIFYMDGYVNAYTSYPLRF